MPHECDLGDASLSPFTCALCCSNVNPTGARSVVPDGSQIRTAVQQRRPIRASGAGLLQRPFFPSVVGTVGPQCRSTLPGVGDGAVEPSEPAGRVSPPTGESVALVRIRLVSDRHRRRRASMEASEEPHARGFAGPELHHAHGGRGRTAIAVDAWSNCPGPRRWGASPQTRATMPGDADDHGANPMSTDMMARPGPPRMHILR